MAAPTGGQIEGVGCGGDTIAALPWFTAAEQFIDWGDVDSDGLKILSEFRAADIPATSIHRVVVTAAAIMDPVAYQCWRCTAPDVNARGWPLPGCTPLPVPVLTGPEAELYPKPDLRRLDKAPRMAQGGSIW